MDGYAILKELIMLSIIRTLSENAKRPIVKPLISKIASPPLKYFGDKLEARRDITGDSRLQNLKKDQQYFNNEYLAGKSLMKQRMDNPLNFVGQPLPDIRGLRTRSYISNQAVNNREAQLMQPNIFQRWNNALDPKTTLNVYPSDLKQYDPKIIPTAGQEYYHSYRPDTNFELLPPPEFDK